MIHKRHAPAIALVALLSASALNAQSELPATLSRPARDTIERLVEVARAAGAPIEPLIAKAHEGVLKRASEERIIWAVRLLLQRQTDARSVIPGATSAALATAVSALQAGISVETLRKLVNSSVNNGDREIAFITVADLVASRVPPEAAAASVEQLLRRRAPLAEFENFRATVTRDIAAGQSPDAALLSRTQALVRTLDARKGSLPTRP